MPQINTICVFCGSRDGYDTRVGAAAIALGQELARRNVHLVYGAGRAGVMGMLAEATLQAGGKVTGVIPDHLVRSEGIQPGLTELITTSTMHVRKQTFYDLSDAFVALPGGLGTLDEIIEVLTWQQLKLHDKPLWLLDVDDFWAPFEALLKHRVDAGFAGENVLKMFEVVSSLNDLFAHFDTTSIQTPHAPSRNSKQVM